MRALRGKRERARAGEIVFSRTMSVLCLNSVRRAPKRSNSNLQICRLFAVFHDGCSLV